MEDAVRNMEENVRALLKIRWSSEFNGATAWYTRRELPLLRSALDAESCGLFRRQWMVDHLRRKIAELEAA
jgi:hypothetical protein